MTTKTPTKARQTPKKPDAPDHADPPAGTTAANLLRADLRTSSEPTTPTITRLTKRAHDYAAHEAGLTEAQLLTAAQTVLEVGRLGHVANAQIASAMLTGWLERRDREVQETAA